MKKILLVCSAGMSTAILVNKMKAAAEEQGIECIIEAHGQTEVSELAGKWDVCLVGPQIKYLRDQIAETMQVPTEVIDMRVYGMADGNKALARALELIAE